MIVLGSDSESPAEEVGGVADDSDGEGPLKHETPRIRRQMQASVPGPSRVILSSDEDEDEDGDKENGGQGNVRSSQSLPNQAAPDDDNDDGLPTRTPRSSLPRRGQRIIDKTEDDDEEDADEDVQTPAKRRKLSRLRKPAVVESDPESSEGLFGTPKLKNKSQGRATQNSSPPASSARCMRSGARKHRSTREKRMELLRRHRAGEKDLTIEDLDTSEDEQKGGLYDTDTDCEALSVFDDDEEPEEQTAATTKTQKKALKKARTRALKERAKGRGKKGGVRDEDEDEEDFDFIDDDDDTLGVPDEALQLMPLEFTRSAIKPLKEHFKDAVDWLVQRRINPSFDKNAEVYARAWRKLSDEVTGLANSKFISSVWRPDFHKALKARPYIEQVELGVGSIASQFESCQACGRSGHPATWTIRPYGKPYDPNTLDEVDSDSEDEDEEDEDEEGKGDRGKYSDPLLKQPSSSITAAKLR